MTFCGYAARAALLGNPGTPRNIQPGDLAYILSGIHLWADNGWMRVKASNTSKPLTSQFSPSPHKGRTAAGHGRVLVRVGICTGRLAPRSARLLSHGKKPKLRGDLPFISSPLHLHYAQHCTHHREAGLAHCFISSHMRIHRILLHLNIEIFKRTAFSKTLSQTIMMSPKIKSSSVIRYFETGTINH